MNMFVLLILGAAAAAAGRPATFNSFEAYKKAFGKTYASADHESAARAAFLANDALIVAHNAENHTYWLGHNAFSDLTWEEFHAGKISGNDRPRRPDFSLLNQPVNATELDWVARGAITPIKNQETCGSCWAFSAVGAVEGAYQISGHALTSLSVQQLVSCDDTSEGCDGGFMTRGFDYIASNPLCTNEAYPYVASNVKCQTTCTGLVGLSGYADVPGEDGMLAAIAKGPVAVGIEATNIMLYAGGVFDNDMCGESIDHGVLVVGFGTDVGVKADYYKVKNSWGDTWGEAGYIRMVRGKNMCGIANNASYPTGVTNSTPTPPPTPSPGPAKQYVIAGMASGSMPVYEFTVQGDVAAELGGQRICLHGGQYVLEKATFFSGMTYCDLTPHTSMHSIADIGDVFVLGLCP